MESTTERKAEYSLNNSSSPIKTHLEKFKGFKKKLRSANDAIQSGSSIKQ